MIRINVFKRVTGSRIVFMVALLASSGELLYGMENKTGLKIPTGFLKNIPLKKIANTCTFPVRLVHGYVKQYPRAAGCTFFLMGTFFVVHKWFHNMRETSSAVIGKYRRQFKEDSEAVRQMENRSKDVLDIHGTLKQDMNTGFNSLEKIVSSSHDEQTESEMELKRSVEKLELSANNLASHEEHLLLTEEIRNLLK